VHESTCGIGRSAHVSALGACYSRRLRKIKADGQDQNVVGNPYYDAMSVKVLNDRSIEETENIPGFSLLGGARHSDLYRTGDQLLIHLHRVDDRGVSGYFGQSRCGSKYVNPINSSQWVEVRVNP
jgi:hypothetical protein